MAYRIRDRSYHFARAMVVCVALVGTASGDAAEPRRAPDWTLDDIDGRSVHFHAEAAGKPAVLVFWTTWCPHCRALFPALERVRADFAGRGVHFYALNVWEDGDPEAYLRDHGYHLPLLLAADLVAEDYGISGTPGVYVTDERLYIRYQRSPGAEPTVVEHNLRTTLESLLGAGAP